MKENYLNDVKKLFLSYKNMGEKAMAQVDDAGIAYQPNEESNSIAIIVKHLWGNMMSRWTDFLTTDGEKPWRERDEEFLGTITTKEELLKKWEQGWDCLISTLESLKPDDMEKIVYIRNEGHTVTEAINRQIAHYAYHVGQIVYIAKILASDNWQTLSIARNKSADFNTQKFSQEKQRKHFTEE